MPWSADPTVLRTTTAPKVWAPLLQQNATANNVKQDVAHSVAPEDAPEETLEETIDRIIALKLQGSSIIGICRLTHIERRKLYDLMQTKLFQKKYASAVKENLTSTLDVVNQSGAAASKFLANVINDVTNNRYSTEHRINVARFILQKQIEFAQALNVANTHLEEEELIPIRKEPNAD
jgi:hypothetical protein